MAETVPGGRYLGADGKLHDANGNPIKDGGKAEKDEDEKDSKGSKKK